MSIKCEHLGKVLQHSPTGCWKKNLYHCDRLDKPVKPKYDCGIRKCDEYTPDVPDE